MLSAPHQLEGMAEKIRNGVVPPTKTVRTFLGWFEAERRGYVIVSNIRSTLEQVGLETDPDFEYAYIDGHISFVLANQESGSQRVSESIGSAIADPTHRIDRLSSAHRKPVSVAPDSTLVEATTLMLSHDFSQLPVMTSEREVKGVVSWKSIGSRLSLGKECAHVRDCMGDAQIIENDASLFSAIEIVAEHDYVLVRDSDRAIIGIVTASDLSQEFRELSEPFLLIGEIENHLRRMIYGKFNEQDFCEARNSADGGSTVDSISDLTLGEYVRLLENPARWEKLKLAVDRQEFVTSLDAVREIRNEVMHFAPERLTERQLKTIRDFVKFQRNLREMGVA